MLHGWHKATQGAWAEKDLGLDNSRKMKATLWGQMGDKRARDNRNTHAGDHNPMEACTLGRETLHISPSVSTSKFGLPAPDGEIWSLKSKLQPVAACPPFPSPLSPDSFALFSCQLIYMTFFPIAALGITFNDSVSCCVKRLLSELLKGKSPHLTFIYGL